MRSPIEQELDELYREVILDHYRNPRNPDPVADAQIRAEGFNPFCGDQVSLQIKLNSSGTIEGVGLQGGGCSISQASASMLTELLKGKTLDEAEAASDTFRRLMHGDPVDKAARVARGGGWIFTARYCRSADRSGVSPSYRDVDLGFRVAAVPVGK